jgi:Chaperone of endosialidase
MSNHDLTIANGPGINVRQDIEAALQALGTNFFGPAVPLITYPCQIWADSAAGVLRIRNTPNTAWITLGPLDTANFGLLPLTGGTISGPLTVSGTFNCAAIIALNITTSGGAGIGTFLNVGTAMSAQGSITSNQTYLCTVPSGQNALYQMTVTGTRAWYAGCLASTGGFYITDQSASAVRFFIDVAGNTNVSNGLNVGTHITFGGTCLGGNVLGVDGASGGGKALQYTTNGSLRWYMQSDATAEGAGNAGSNFSLTAWSNAGANLGTVYSVVRATRVVTFGVAIVNPSDIRLKTDVEPVGNALDLVEALEGVYYRKIAEPERRQVGLIAQDVRAIFPEVVFETADQNDDGEAILGIEYGKLVPVLINAIKELSAKVATLEGVTR